MSNSNGQKSDSGIVIILMTAVLLFGAWFGLKNTLVTNTVKVVGQIATFHTGFPIIGKRAEIIQTVSNSPKAVRKMQGSFVRFMKYLSLSGLIILPYVMIVGFGIFWFCLRADIRKKYTGEINFRELLNLQQHQFPRIMPVMWLVDRINKGRGAFDYALTPWEWAFKHNVIDNINPKQSWDADAAKRAFQAQLKIPNELSDICETLYHIFLSMGAKELVADFVATNGSIEFDYLSDKLLGDLLLDEIARNITFEPTVQPELLKEKAKYKNNKLLWMASYSGPVLLKMEFPPELQDIFKRMRERKPGETTEVISSIKAGFDGQHHYQVCRLVSALERAQSTLSAGGGGVPPNGMLWMKYYNRTVWYAIHGVGMDVAWTEAAGIRSHCLHEKINGSTVEPFVAHAVRALYTELEVESWQAPDSLNGEIAAAIKQRNLQRLATSLPTQVAREAGA